MSVALGEIKTGLLKVMLKKEEEKLVFDSTPASLKFLRGVKA